MTSKYIIKSLLMVLTLASVMNTGCKPKLLPSTNVKATKQNKRIIKFLEKYKSALEKRSVDAVMELVAKDFKDNMGTENPEHQLDYLGLKEALERYLPRVKDMRIGMFIQHIAKIQNGVFEVVFYFSKHALTELPTGEKWISTKEVNRMVIRETKDEEAKYEFEILKGL